jgi:hypothetical protein
MINPIRTVARLRGIAEAYFAVAALLAAASLVNGVVLFARL